VRVARLASLAVLAGLLSIAAPSLGLSSSTPNAVGSGSDCGRTEFVSGLEAVLNAAAELN
jgi:hypothetical protein